MPLPQTGRFLTRTGGNTIMAIIVAVVVFAIWAIIPWEFGP